MKKNGKTIQEALDHYRDHEKYKRTFCFENRCYPSLMKLFKSELPEVKVNIEQILAKHRELGSVEKTIEYYRKRSKRFVHNGVVYPRFDLMCAEIIPWVHLQSAYAMAWRIGYDHVIDYFLNKKRIKNALESDSLTDFQKELLRLGMPLEEALKHDMM